MQPGFNIGDIVEAAVDDPGTRVYAIAGIAMPVFALVSYTFLTLDRRRPESPMRDDGQLGLKVLLFSALAVSALLAAAGARDVLAFILGGFKGGWRAMRGPLATAIAGGGAGAAIYFLLLPRTNHTEKPQAERLAVGMVGVWLGTSALAAVALFLNNLFAARPWADISDALASIGVNGGVTVLMILRLGALSGWRAIPRVPPMPMAPPMTGYPPQQGGGYPPQGGGMPPLGGGYPPTSQGGGGWPTQ